MTANEAALLRAVIARPDNDLPRLVFADWLEEHGDDYRSQFIRLQLELAKPYLCQSNGPAPLGDHDIPMRCGACDFVAGEDGWEGVHVSGRYKKCNARAALRRRERDLLIIYGNDWIPSACQSLHLVPALDGGGARFRRGFVESVTCTAADFLAHVDALRAATPLRKVRITQSPEMRFRWSAIPLDGSQPSYEMQCVGRAKIIGAPNTLSINDARACLEYYLKAEFPGLEFELPSERGGAPIGDILSADQQYLLETNGGTRA